MSIKRFSDFVNESYLKGSRTPLYHSSPITNSYGILKEDKLKSTTIPEQFWSETFPSPKAISFTRNKDFIYDNNPVTFILDGDKISDRFKTYPIDYYYKILGSTKPKSVRTENIEFEEVVRAKEIINLHEYLIGIRLNDSMRYFKNFPKNTREEYRESYYFRTHRV